MSFPTNLEQYMLELVNRARNDPNAEAARFGIDLNSGLNPGTLNGAQKQPLAFSTFLNIAADAHSQSMLAGNYFSHTGSDGSSATQRIFGAGWTSATNSWLTGENISLDASTVAINGTDMATIDRQHQGLFKSSGHRENILNNGFSEIGVGQLVGPYTVPQGTFQYTSMITQNFTDGGRQFITGVTINDTDNDDFYDIGEGVGGVTVTAVGTAGTFTTTTWDAGGYQMSVPAGSYTLTFSGNGVNKTANVVVGASNVKVDAEIGGAPVGVNDIFVNTPGNDAFNGEGGVDTVTYVGNRADFSLSKTADGTIVVTGPGAGTDSLMNIEKIQFSDRSYNLEAAQKATTIAAQSLNDLIDLYVAYFNRVPEASGLIYWIDQFLGGKTLGQIAVEFYQAGIQNSATTGYTETMPLSDFIGILYKNVLGRTGDKAPPAADIAFWENQVATGAVTREGLVARFLVDARKFYDDPEFGFVPRLLDKKVEFGKLHAVTYGVDYNDPAAAIQTTVQYAAAVTSTSIDAAVNLVGLGADDYFV